MRRLCDSNTYVTMITLCGPWHQLPRALHLMADMQAQQMECGPQVINCGTQAWLLPALSMPDLQAAAVLLRSCCIRSCEA